MVIAYWIVAGLTAAVFLAAGLTKIVRPKLALAEMGMTYVEDFAAPTVKLIGTLEALGALGLVLPMLTGIAPILSPIAGVGLAVVMIGAVVTHVRRGEKPIPNIPLFLIAAASAVLGFAVVLG